MLTELTFANGDSFVHGDSVEGVTKEYADKRERVRELLHIDEGDVVETRETLDWMLFCFVIRVDT